MTIASLWLHIWKKVTNNNDANNGFKLPKPKPKVWVKKNVIQSVKPKDYQVPVSLKNTFSALNDLDDQVSLKEMGESSNTINNTSLQTNKEVNMDDNDSDIEEIIMEQRPKGASTPSNKTSNANLCNKGCRIIVGWDVQVVDLLVLAQMDQVLHTKVLMEDFNAALNLEDIFFGSSIMNASMIEFKDCVANIEIIDINASGLHYTQNQKPRGGKGILKKLDRCMGNMEFIDEYVSAYAIYQPYRNSDHAPMWSMLVEGHSMYQLVTKYKPLKKPFRKMMHDNGNLHDRVTKLCIEVDEIQKALDKNPADPILREEEVAYVHAFNEAKLDEERFLKQKAKVDWLEARDANTAYFHKTIKSRKHKSRIEVMQDANGVDYTSLSMPEAFVNHYKDFLGTDMLCDDMDSTDLFLKQVSKSYYNDMVRVITNAKIKYAMFDIGDDRAPGPDGFSSAFFKKGWDIVGDDACNGIKDVVSDNQSAFIPGRRISDNILITQELMHNYHRKRGPPRCAFKVDIQKAYDTIDWKFLEHILHKFSFNLVIIKWIMACVASSLFSIGLKGDIHGFFKGKRGLVPSIPKSTVFFYNMGNTMKNEILGIMSFLEGNITAMYLGVPFISSWLLNQDCKILVEKAKNRIGDWKNKSLSFAGRLQLCKSILSSMQIYWALVLVIPKAKVAWDYICLPKIEGGLGLRSLEKLLQTRELIKPFIWVKIGNGKDTSLWHDLWDTQSPLSRYLSPRDITREGYHLKNAVANLVSNNAWSRPNTWLLKAPNIGQIQALNLIETKLRPRGNVINWHKIVWFSHAVPRHSFHMWIVMRKALKTQDKLHMQDLGGMDPTTITHLARMEYISPIMDDIVAYLIPMAHKRNVLSVIGKLIVAVVQALLEVNENFFKKAEEKLSLICAKRVMLEEYMRKARLENHLVMEVIGLHEKYFNLFKDPILFEDDGNGNNVGDDDDWNGDDGDDDANDGDGNVDENDANECDKNPNGSNQSFDFNKISLDDFGNDSGPTELEPVDLTKQGTVVDVNTAEEGENIVENCGIMSSPEEFTQWLNKNVNLVGEACDSIVTEYLHGDLFGDNSAAREALNEVVTPQIQPIQKRVVKHSSYVFISSLLMNKKTNVVPKITKMEFIVGNSLFAMQGDKLENVFEAHFEKFVLYGIRLNLRFRAADSKSRHFFPTGCITESMLDGTFTSFDEKWKRFSDQVNAQFNGNEGGRGLEGIDLNITFESHEIQNESHEIHSKSHKIHSESHKIHSESYKIQSESHEIRKDPMRLIFESHVIHTKENFYDCGIFIMLHMENFNGGPASDFDCGLPVESQLQLYIMRRLRFKFATKILLHEINLQSEKIVEFAKEFDKKGPSEKILIIIDAIKNREEHDHIDN
ncbi:hypothetical protein Tco_0549255 [Tanacetum coccineum]